MKQRGSKRVWAAALALILCLGLLPGTALAEDSLDGSGGIYVTGLAMADATWTCNGGTAVWVEATDTLTLKGTGTITGDNTVGIGLPGGATLAVAAGAKWTVTGASRGDGAGSNGIYFAGALTVDDGASLDIRGGDSSSKSSGSGLSAIGALTITVAQGGSLTATGGTGSSGGYGISGSQGVTLDNGGTVTAMGGNNGSGGAGIIAQAPGLTVNGSGVLRCQGYDGIATKENGQGGAGKATITGGTVIALGTGDLGSGISTNDGTLTVGAGAAVTAVGKNGGIRGTVSGDGTWFQTTADVSGFDETDHSTGLDLSSVTTAQLYTNVGGGAALWLPEGNPNFLALTGAKITGGGLHLPGENVGLGFTGNCQIGENTGASAAIRGGNTLTFFAEAGSSVEIRNEGGLGISAAAPLTFTDGNFRVYAQGAANQAITVTGGEVKLEGLEGPPSVPALAPGFGVTADPTQAAVRTAWHAELTTQNMGIPVHLPGSPSNSPISYSGGASYVKAAILAGAVTDPVLPGPQPEDDGGDGPAAFHVVYRPGYDGPQSVRAGGYEEGEAVTLRDNPFPAPQGRTFAGWGERENGGVKYRPGDKFTMPGKQVELFAQWAGHAPAMNREDHTAYLQGYADGTVRPAGLLTREQTAAIFFRLLDAESRERYLSSTSPFPDVADARWSATAIATMANAGVLQGRRDGRFHPADPVTHAEFAAIAARFDAEEYDGPDLFSDIAGHWAAEEINRAAQKGWVKGGADGRFRPDDPITRAEAAAMINRVLGRAPETAEDLLPGMRTFSDNPQDAWHYLDLQEAANAHDYTRKPDALHETWTALTPQP